MVLLPTFCRGSEINIENCYTTTPINNSTGALIGEGMPQNYRNKINIKKCYTTEKIEHAFSGGFIHYFVGKESEINIEDSYTGDIGNQALWDFLVLVVLKMVRFL